MLWINRGRRARCYSGSVCSVLLPGWKSQHRVFPASLWLPPSFLPHPLSISVSPCPALYFSNYLYFFLIFLFSLPLSDPIFSLPLFPHYSEICGRPEGPHTSR